MPVITVFCNFLPYRVKNSKTVLLISTIAVSSQITIIIANGHHISNRQQHNVLINYIYPQVDSASMIYNCNFIVVLVLYVTTIIYESSTKLLTAHYKYRVLVFYESRLEQNSNNTEVWHNYVMTWLFIQDSQFSASRQHY